MFWAEHETLKKKKKKLQSKKDKPLVWISQSYMQKYDAILECLRSTVKRSDDDLGYNRLWKNKWKSRLRKACDLSLKNHSWFVEIIDI